MKKYYIKKQRYKPLYKKFLKLRKNVQNRQKLIRNKDNLNFKKRKWQNLVTYLQKYYNRKVRRFKNIYIKKFRIYDHYRYFVPKFGNSFKNKFRYRLQIKQRLSLFYGELLEKYLKKKIKLSLKKKKSLRKSLNPIFYFIEILETRLDTILYRAHFTLSIRNAQQLISHGHIYVNDIVVKSSSYNLKKGDLIRINPKINHLIKTNTIKTNFWPLPPKYLQINYRTLQILYSDEIVFNNMSIQYTFWLDLNTIMTYYKY